MAPPKYSPMVCMPHEWKESTQKSLLLKELPVAGFEFPAGKLDLLPIHRYDEAVRLALKAQCPDGKFRRSNIEPQLVHMFDVATAEMDRKWLNPSRRDRREWIRGLRKHIPFAKSDAGINSFQFTLLFDTLLKARTNNVLLPLKDRNAPPHREGKLAKAIDRFNYHAGLNWTHDKGEADAAYWLMLNKLKQHGRAVLACAKEVTADDFCKKDDEIREFWEEWAPMINEATKMVLEDAEEVEDMSAAEVAKFNYLKGTKLTAEVEGFIAAAQGLTLKEHVDVDGATAAAQGLAIKEDGDKGGDEMEID